MHDLSWTHFAGNGVKERKRYVYADKPQTLDHLEDNIRRVIADIRPQMLEKVIENWTSRLDYIRASRGSPMPEIIFKIKKKLVIEEVVHLARQINSEAAKKTPTTRRNSNDSTASEEPPEVTDMDIPLPASPQASRPGTPEKDGPAQLHCTKLQQLTEYIQRLSSYIETSEKILQNAISKGVTDPTDPIIRMEAPYLELNNSRLQKAVSEYTSLPPVISPTVRDTTFKTLHLSLTHAAQLHQPRLNVRKIPKDLLPPSRKLTKNAHSNANPESNFKINLNNAFSALDITETDEPIETQVLTNKSPVTTPSKTNPTQPPKLPPPIMLLITDDLRLHTKTLTSKMPTLRIKAAGNYVKLYTDTQPQHDTLKQLLTELKYPFYSFTPKHERPIKVVIKGLPRTTKTAEIQSDLLDLGYTINKVTQLTGNITKQLLSVFTISLPRNDFNLNIFNLKTLGYLSITVEGFESRGVIQCFQCNQFNHTAEHCNLTPKCLKCGDKHQTRDCQIKKLDTPFCVNCQVHGHMANYSKCPLYTKPRKGTNIKLNSLISNNFIRPNISYAQVTQRTINADATQQMAPLATAPIHTQTTKEIPTPTILTTQIPNTQNDCITLITQTLQQTIRALSTLVENISLMTSPQTVSTQPTPGPNMSTSKTALTKTQIIAQINTLLNHYDGASD
ncbi:nucleic-acid-binding protein from transposon X-element [Trichonephila clavipes]|nr:nucleic-acid-binding protein from transposon X-element [Trichonephila clavipes]